MQESEMLPCPLVPSTAALVHLDTTWDDCTASSSRPRFTDLSCNSFAMYASQRTLSQQTDEEGSLAVNDDEAPLLRGTRVIKVSHAESGTASMMSCIANL